jgi:non-heme chloroperoxidase
MLSVSSVFLEWEGILTFITYLKTFGVLLTVLFTFQLLAQQDAPDTSPHSTRLVQVAPDVKLELLDWGGTGRPMIFLGGLGFTAHEFDEFAPKFTNNYHVYGVTRRGFGASSAPAPDGSNYTADRLGDDVLAVINSLSLQKPILVGHSLAGEEMSSIGSRRPDAVTALIYLDAAYSYALYDDKRGDLILDSIALRYDLNSFLTANTPDVKAFLTKLQSDVDRYNGDIKRQLHDLSLLPPQPPRTAAPPPVMVAISAGKQKYTKIPVPCLAIFAGPHRELTALFPNDPKAHSAVLENDGAASVAQADAFKAAVSGSHVVVLPNASHMIFSSNASDVEREMRSFLLSLR